MEHGFRPLKAGKMHPNALKTLPSGAARQGGAEPPLPRSASAPQVYVVLLFFSFIHVAQIALQPCSRHRAVLEANRTDALLLFFLVVVSMRRLRITVPVASDSN